MAEKWIVRGTDNTSLYGVFDESGEMRSTHRLKVDAQKMAASPLMLEALQRLLYLIERDDNVTHNIEYADSTILDQARAAIAAAKGE
jgi:hypothetical protein